MAEEYYQWKCENQDCQAKNNTRLEKIESVVNSGKSAVLICANCGFVNSSQPGVVLEEPGKPTWLPCIAFEGAERRLPTGRTPDGWKDYMGRALSRDKFITKYQVEPEICLAWIKKGRPRAID